MSRYLTLAEQETVLAMVADDRSTWMVFSDDPVMQRRIEAVGAVTVKSSPDGVSKWYTLPAKQISFRKPAKPLTQAQKAQLAKQLRAGRTASVNTGAETLEIDATLKEPT